MSVRYEVRHNTGNGYLLSLTPRLGLDHRVEVLGLDGAIELRDRLHRSEQTCQNVNVTTIVSL